MHEFLLHRDASIPVLVFDVDRDGDQDLIWGRGHNVGLYWLEQQITESKRTWVRHAIDTSWSCAHSLLLVDLDGDGQRDLVAGKRYLGHDGKDPGEWQPLMIAAYRWQPESKTWHRDVLSEGGTCAMDLQAAHGDLDGDGDQDLVLAARSGLFLLENRTVSSSLSSSSSLVVSATPTKTHVETDQDATRETTGYPSEMPLLIYRDETTQEELEVQSPLAWGHRRQQIIDNMERVMGPLPTSSQRVPLNVVVESREQADGYTRYKLTFQAELGDRVPAYLLIPDGLREPTAAMLCLHPTHVLGKSQVCGLGGAPSRFYAHELARRGYVCLAPDYPSFGDYSYDFATTGTRYVSGSMKAIWNNVRALDLLESLPEVDGDRVGCIGHSLGGHNALFTAVFDLRLRVVVTSCGFTAFDSYYDGDLTGWTSARYMPRIDTEFRKEPARMPFDFHEVLAAIAPRPVFINAPMNDDNFSVAGVKKVVERVTPVYAMLGAMESLRVRYPESGHDFPDAVREEVYEWLDSSLKR
jgi:dienelactone hydrolase